MITVLLLICAVVLASSYLINIIGSTLFDLKRSNSLRSFKYPHKRRPYISVVINSDAQNDNLNECIKSLLKCRYKNLEIIVVDSTEVKLNKNIVQVIAGKNVNKQIRYVESRGNDNSKIIKTIKHLDVGDLVFFSNSSTTFEPNILKNAASYFNKNKNLDIALVKKQTIRNQTITSLINYYSSQLVSISLKTKSLLKTNINTFDQNFFFKADLLTKATDLEQILANSRVGFSSQLLVYAPEVSVYSYLIEYLVKQTYQVSQLFSFLIIKKSSSLKKRLWAYIQLFTSLLTRLVGLFLPLLLGYFVYLAVELHEPDFLIVSWAVLGTYLIFAISQDEHINLRHKLAFIALSPIYFSWYIISLILRCFAFLTGLILACTKIVSEKYTVYR